jgi:hypothetical protein
MLSILDKTCVSCYYIFQDDTVVLYRNTGFPAFWLNREAIGRKVGRNKGV